MRRPHVRLRNVLALLACAAEGTAAVLVVLVNTWAALGAGTALHVGAALLSTWAARRRRPDLGRAERDLVLGTALLVPLFGPCVAWAMPRPKDAGEEKNAHAVFEEYSEHVRPALPDYERTVFTGDYERDLARELDAESYHEVLRHGSTDQKRNALRRLAELGAPHHFALIRRCLVDPSHEVRLYAYSELERCGRRYEEEIAERAKQLERDPANAEAALALAGTYFHYAASGIHDQQMAFFYFKSAERYAEQARAAAEGPEPVWLLAASLGRRGEAKAAIDALAGLPPAAQEQPQSCVLRAELAFKKRDFAACRVEAERLRSGGHDLPPWLGALGGES